MTEGSSRNYRSGFVALIGEPNAGKSTLINQLIGEKLSPVTYKAQTTRHEIKAIQNLPNCQIIFLDTPGFVAQPAHELHKKMNLKVQSSILSADVIVYVIDATKKELNHDILKWLSAASCPIIPCLNKTDKEASKESKKYLAEKIKELNPLEPIEISALYEQGVEALEQKIISLLPENPPFFGTNTDEISDLPLRFFVKEIIREKIFMLYDKEVPYASEVVVQEYIDTEKEARIYVYIFVERESQKGIMLGKKGTAIKKLSQQSREAIEAFIQKKPFLDITVKVRKNWRQSNQWLDQFGYSQT